MYQVNWLQKIILKSELRKEGRKELASTGSLPVWQHWLKCDQDEIRSFYQFSHGSSRGPNTWTVYFFQVINWELDWKWGDLTGACMRCWHCNRQLYLLCHSIGCFDTCFKISLSISPSMPSSHDCLVLREVKIMLNYCL